MVGQSAELAYATAVCQYRQRDYPAALASLAEIVEQGVQQHPELGIGTQTEGMEVRSGYCSDGQVGLLRKWPSCCIDLQQA